MRIDLPHWVPLLCSGKNLTVVSVLSTLAFYLGVAFYHQGLQTLIVSLANAFSSSSLIWHWIKEWMDIKWKNKLACWMKLVGWHVQAISIWCVSFFYCYYFAERFSFVGSLEIGSSNIRNDVIKIKCWMKQGVNQSNMKIVLDEPENVGWEFCSRSNFHPTQ